MPNIDTMKTSNYLKKEDVGQGVLVTINRMEPKMVTEDGKEKKIWLIYFAEFQKPLWSNGTHREQIAGCLHSRISEDWTGKQITLWNDLSEVNFGKVGAIRVKPAEQPQAQSFPQGQSTQHPGMQTQTGGVAPEQPPQGFTNPEDPGFN